MPSVQYITIFGPNHLLYLTILAVSIVLLFFNRNKLYRHRKTISISVLCASLLQQIFLYGSYWLEGFPLSEALPLHISRINTLLGILFLITHSPRLVPYLTYLSMFAWLSFIYPSQVEPITHIRGVSFLMNHIITLLLPLYVMIAYRIPLNPRAKWKVYGAFLVYLSIVVLINPLVDGNYFYLKEKPLIPQAPLWFFLIMANLVTLLLFYLADLIYHPYLQHQPATCQPVPQND